ncbi:MAG: DUF2330 domain-containing protein [Polyangiaceae bacterium]
MRQLRLGLGLLGFTVGVAALAPNDARACGGGVVQSVDENVAVEAQRVFVSVRDSGVTDIVVQLDVTSSADYGVLLPVPDLPTLDANPVDAAELDGLEARTRVHFYKEEFVDGGGSSSGCGCGSAVDGSNGGLDRTDTNVTASEFVTIGPVVAVVLQADTGDALTTWLTDNGFIVPAADQPIIDSYVGGTHHFIAFKRSDTATGGESSVGVHFTLDGDQRGYPLKMASIGAGEELAITAFVVASDGVGAGGPFATLTIDQLPTVDGETADEITDSYKSAIRTAVGDRAGKAFVAEGVFDALNVVHADTEPTLNGLVDDNKKLTRITTIVDPATLDTDVAFTAPAPTVVPTERELGTTATSGPSSVKPQSPSRGNAPLGLAVAHSSPRAPPPAARGLTHNGASSAGDDWVASVAALGRRARAEVGAADLTLLHRLKLSTRLAELAGRGFLVFAGGTIWGFALGTAALAYYFSVEAQLNHTITHGAYIGVKNAGRYTPARYESLALPFQSKTWRDAHRIHHAEPSILGRDPDTEHALFRVHSATPFRITHYLNGLVGAITAFETWAFEYDTFLKARGHREARDRGELRKFAFYTLYQYGLFAALAGSRWYAVILATLLASVIRNLIFTALQTASSVGHEVSTKHAHASVAGAPPESFLRLQLESSKNFVLRSRLFRILCGGLDRHIEHHLYPHLPPERLRALSSDVRALCERHQIAYSEYPSIWSSLGDSIGYLARLGRRP